MVLYLLRGIATSILLWITVSSLLLGCASYCTSISSVSNRIIDQRRFRKLCQQQIEVSCRKQSTVMSNAAVGTAACHGDGGDGENGGGEEPIEMKNAQGDLLVRALRGEYVERSPVWLMRQAGRYMKDFRSYAEKYTFRERSESPEIATELSLQPWRAFKTDGVIMFSDILTPLPAMGIEFDIVPGMGPRIKNPIKTVADIRALRPLLDCENQLPFVGQTLRNLKTETKNKTSLIGFIGAPWTLAAYSVEGGQSKLCTKMKRMCLEDSAAAHLLLGQLSASLYNYARYQIEGGGADIIQIFDSWAHHMSETIFNTFAKPYVQFIVHQLREDFPHVPVIYFANGGSGYIEEQIDVGAHALAVDWRISMKSARQRVDSHQGSNAKNSNVVDGIVNINASPRHKEGGGGGLVLMGNVDPISLYGSEQSIRKAVRQCIDEGTISSAVAVAESSGSRGSCGSSSSSSSSSGSRTSSSPNKKRGAVLRRGHVLNLGHGVEKDTSEAAVAAFVHEARSYMYSDEIITQY